MRILVTGATGFLGRTLLSLEGEAEWMGCGRRPTAEDIPYRQVDLADRQAVAALVAELAPDWVINAAAMTDVDGCEKDARAARQANVDIPENLAVACDAAGAGLIHISTDYVFDGKRGPYREGDAANPLSCYGQLKLESEGILKKMERVPSRADPVAIRLCPAGRGQFPHLGAARAVWRPAATGFCRPVG